MKMKKIVLNSIAFIILFCGTNLYLKNTSTFYKQEKEYQKPIDQLEEGKSNIILLGDSHLASLKKLNLDPKIANLAYGADGIKEMYAKSLLLVNKIQNIDYVLVSTEPQMFNAGTSPNGTFLNRYIFDLEEARTLYNKNKLDVICDAVPLFNNDYLNFFRNKTYLTLKGTSSSKNEKSWEDLSIKEKEAQSSELGKLDHSSIMSQSQDTIYFNKMMELFQQNNIKVISIKFPVTPSYFKECSQEDLNNVNKYLQQFSFYETMDYTHAIDSLSYFEDPDHLKKKGVKQIAKDIEKQTGLSIL